MNQNVQINKQLYIAEWQVDESSNSLIQGERVIKLESKMMDLLIFLSQRPGVIVGREEIETTVWANSVVGYDALTGCITKLRKVLGDNPRNPTFIETVSKKGYRLIAPVREIESKPEVKLSFSNHAKKSSFSNLSSGKNLVYVASLLLILLLVGFAASYFLPSQTDQSQTQATPVVDAKSGLMEKTPPVLTRPSITILPFVDLSPDQSQQYFSNGITADITTAISKLSGLFVISWSSASSFINQNATLEQVSASLGVRYVLEGKVRREKDALRVNVQLVDATTGIHLWAERYDRKINDILRVQDDIAEKIVAALSISLTTAEKNRKSKRYTSSIAAYDDFLKAQASYQRASFKDTLEARKLFQRAIDRDPNFARAYGAMALSYVDEFRFRWGVSNGETLSKALSLAQKAVSLDKNLPQAYWVLGYVHLHRKEYDKAMASMLEANVLDPNNADVYGLLGLISVYQDQPKKAVRLIEKAKVLNPHYSAHYPSVLGQAYYSLGEYKLAVKALSEAIERNLDLLTAHVYLVAALAKLNQHEEAQWQAEQIRLIAPEFSVSDIGDLFPFNNPMLKTEIVDQFIALGF